MQQCGDRGSCAVALLTRVPIWDADTGAATLPILECSTIRITPFLLPRYHQQSTINLQGVPMSPIKPTVAWWSFEQVGLTTEQLINAAVDTGYAGIEFAPRLHWPLIREQGLKIVCIRGHDDITNGLNDPSQHDRIEREILANLELAGRWDIPMFVCFSGERKGLDDEAGAVNTTGCLGRVAKAAEDAGVLLVLELLNSKVNHPDYQCDHTAWGVNVIERVDSPAVKLLYDIYHMQICLLYTSDAADDLLCVDLGGRR